MLYKLVLTFQSLNKVIKCDFKLKLLSSTFLWRCLLCFTRWLSFLSFCTGAIENGGAVLYRVVIFAFQVRNLEHSVEFELRHIVRGGETPWLLVSMS